MNDNLSLTLAYIFIKLNVYEITLETLMSIVKDLDIDCIIDIKELNYLRFNSAIFTFYDDGKSYKVALRYGITLEELTDYFMKTDIKKRTK